MTSTSTPHCIRQTAAAALCALAVGAATARAAGDDSGVYLTVFGGVGFLSEDALRLNQDGASNRSDVDYDSGFISGAALGYRFSESLRLEGEFAYRTNELSAVQFGDGARIDEGDFSSLVIGVNGYYDFVAPGRSLVPYVGLGVAWAQEIDIDFELPGGEQSYSGDEVGFQAMLGARYQTASRWSLNAELRYLSLGDVTLEREGGRGDQSRGEVDARYEPLSVMLGVTYRW